MNWVKIEYKDEKTLPPLERGVLVCMEWTPGNHIYGVLKRVDSEDHTWETTDDGSEISNALNVIAWCKIDVYMPNHKPIANEGENLLVNLEKDD